MPGLFAIAAALLLLAALLFGYTLRSLKRRRVLRATAGALTGLTATLSLAVAVLFLMSYLSYDRLTHEEKVAAIEFSSVAPREFRARFMVDGERDRFFLLAGDAWQVDARLLTWSPPASILGLEPLYKLERLSGRYEDIAEEREAPRTVHALTVGEPVDLWTVAHRLPLLAPGVDAYYGSATYVPMVAGARFDISLSRDAVIARPANDVARRAVEAWQ